MTRKPRQDRQASPPARSPTGAAADICLFDPNEKWLYDAKKGTANPCNSPWSGQKLTGRVKTTIVDGRVVYESGKMSRPVARQVLTLD
jgi:dihydroorotase